MEPRGRYVETLFLLASRILYKVLALPTSIQINDKTGPGKEVQQIHLFLCTSDNTCEHGVILSPAKFPYCVLFATRAPKVAKVIPGRPRDAKSD